MYIKKFNKNIILNIFSLSLVFMLFGFVPAFALAAGPMGVNLGRANSFVILAKTGISNTGSSYIVGDLGISPAAASYITGFALSLPAYSGFSISALVNGKVYAPGYADPTPADIIGAVNDMQNAYTDAMGRTNPTATELGAGNIGGMTLPPGLYKWSTGVTIPDDVTLLGNADDVWIFQIAQNLNISSATNVVLSGGAQASNIFWVVAGQTTLGTSSVMNGNVLDQTAIVLNNDSQLNGRALAQTAVTLDSGVVIMPNPIAFSDQTGGGLSTYGGMAGSYNSSIPATATVNTTPTAYQTSPQTEVSMNNSSNSGPIMYDFGTVTLRNGSRGNAVMELQRFLNTKLNLGLVVDGKLGPKTITVIKKWQKDHGLVADGLIGVKTKAMMNASQ